MDGLEYALNKDAKPIMVIRADDITAKYAINPIDYINELNRQFVQQQLRKQDYRCSIYRMRK